jgi:hypothetical protein
MTSLSKGHHSIFLGASAQIGRSRDGLMPHPRRYHEQDHKSNSSGFQETDQEL